MIAALRKEQIKSMVLNQKAVSVPQLAKQFEVSEETIRRDLSALEEEGVLVRKHGGAIISNRVLSESSNRVLENIFVENKHAIAQLCLPFIRNKDCLFFDSSTTAYQLCKELTNMELTVLTNSLSVLNLLSNHKNINLIAVGGTFLNGRGCFVGRGATSALKSYHIDKAFISCRSISLSDGLTEPNENVAEFKQIVIKRSNQVFLLADHSKFNKNSFARICDLNEIDDLVTDCPVTEEWQTYLKNQNIRVWDPKTPHPDSEE